MKRTSIWITAARRRVRVCDMDDQHLNNTISMIERHTEAYMRDPARNMIPIYHEMVAERRERQSHSQTGDTVRQLTEAEAWEKIGEAFEAKAAHPELEVGDYDLAESGLCWAASEIYYADDITSDQREDMYTKIDDERMAQAEAGAFLSPGPTEENGAIDRAALAYLFAAEAA